MNTLNNLKKFDIVICDRGVRYKVIGYNSKHTKIHLMEFDGNKLVGNQTTWKMEQFTSKFKVPYKSSWKSMKENSQMIRRIF